MTSKGTIRKSGINVRSLSSQKGFWIVIVCVILLLVYSSTLQQIINGNSGPYTTDTGEIQNALPRWGLLHPSGYPLYSIIGSTFVSALRLVGIQPALATSILSMIWAIVTAAVMIVLAGELGVTGPFAALGAGVFGLATSVWVDASIAEVHTMSLALSTTSLLFAVRFSNTGSKRDLVWLTFVFAQGIMHQRAIAALLPSIGLIVWNRRSSILRKWRTLIMITALAPLVYLYLVIRKAMGVSWYFGTPETVSGFVAMMSDNVFVWPDRFAVWMERLRLVRQLIANDVLWPLAILGMVGPIILFRQKTARIGIALTLAWIPYIPFTMLIWEGRISDAQLAAKLPVLVIIGLGLSLALDWTAQQKRAIGWGLSAVVLVLLVGWSWKTRPNVLAITRDRSAETTIDTAARVNVSADARQIALMAPWGNTYWALTYAQAYQNRLKGMRLVDHNYDMKSILQRNERLLVLSQTFNVFPISWWEKQLGSDDLFMSVEAPRILELSTLPINNELSAIETPYVMNEDISIRLATLDWSDNRELNLVVFWEAMHPIDRDYSVAVHLLATDSTQLEQPVLAQADSDNPVEGWYPTSSWRAGEIVRDVYTIRDADMDSVAVRIALYHFDLNEGFINSEWLYLQVPPISETTESEQTG